MAIRRRAIIAAATLALVVLMEGTADGGQGRGRLKDMTDDDAASVELLGICEDVLDSDAVTAAAVAQLGKWLDDHEGARRAWPADVLAEPVQKALRDGSTKRDLDQLARVLRRVRKESVRRRQNEEQQSIVAYVTAAKESFDLHQPSLPSMPITIRVESHSEPDVVYTVDLTGPSCDCPAWERSRSHLRRGSPSRCCKHVIDALHRVRPRGGWPGWFETFVEYGWQPNSAKEWFVVDVRERPALFSIGGNDWCDVFALSNGYYQRFGYNIVESRWSYENEPTGARKIADAIVAAQLQASLEREYAAAERDDGRADPPPRIGLLRRIFGRG